MSETPWFVRHRNLIASTLTPEMTMLLDELVAEIDTLQQSAHDLMALAYERGAKAPRDSDGNVMAANPYSDGAVEPLLYTRDQLQAARRHAFDLASEQESNPWANLSVHPSWEVRLRMLDELVEGWSGPGSFAPTPMALARVRGAIAKCARPADDLAVAPNCDGGVEMSWTVDNESYQVSINANGMVRATVAVGSGPPVTSTSEFDVSWFGNHLDVRRRRIATLYRAVTSHTPSTHEHQVPVERANLFRPAD